MIDHADTVRTSRWRGVDREHALLLGALLKHPDADTVMSGFDVLLLAGVEAGVRASGRGSTLKLFGAEGYAPTADLLRSGAVAGGVAVDGDWQGCAYKKVWGVG